MEFDRIIDRMEELVSSSFDSSSFSHITDAQWKPPLDVYESGSCILIVVELAGINADDVKVAVNGSEVTITGYKASLPLKNEEYSCRHMEMLCGRFVRKVRLNPPVTGRTEASYEEGLLKIKIYKEKK